jgi:uncharacterized protein YjbI with pentapeptide repeats
MSLPINYEKFLAPEKWQEIFANVPPKDLCNVMRTSRHIKSLASWPDLWSGMRVNMDMVKQNGLAKLYSIDRYQKITKMNFSASFFTMEELERVIIEVPGSPLENVNLSSNNLGKIPAHLMANTVSHLKTVDLRCTSLTTEQCSKMLEASLYSTTLVNINLDLVNLSEVDPELVANAVCRLQTVGFNLTDLTSQQCVKLMEKSLSSNTLVNMNLRKVNLSGVDPVLLANAVCRLQTVYLGRTDLTSQQCVQLLEKSLTSTTLVNMNLYGVNLSEVDPELLANAVCRLQTVDLGETRLTYQQCVKLMEKSVSSTTLVKVSLYGDDIDEVPTDLLARATVKFRL